MEYEILENLTTDELNELRASNDELFIYHYNCFGKYDVVSFKGVKLERDFLINELIPTLAKIFRGIDFDRTGIKTNSLVPDGEYGFNFVMNLKLLKTKNLSKEHLVLFDQSINLKSDKFKIKDLTNFARG